MGTIWKRVPGATTRLVAVLTFMLVAATPVAASSVYVADGTSGGKLWQFTQGTGGALMANTPATIDDSGRNIRDVVVSPDGHSAYVLENTPSNGAGTGVYEFDVGADGTLTPKSTPSISYASLAAGPGSGLQAAISPDGANLYVADFGGAIHQFTIGPGGVLSRKSPAFVGQSAVGMVDVTVSPDGQSLYATYEGLLGNKGEVLQYDIGAGGALTPKTPSGVLLSGASGAGPLVITPDGSSVYVTATDHFVYQFSVGAGGKLSAKSPATVMGTDPALGALAMSPDGQNLYVGAQTVAAGCNDGPSDILQFHVGSGGQLSQTGSVAGAPTNSGEHDLAVSPDGKHLYAAESCLVGSTSGVRQYDVGTSGGLSPNAGGFIATGPNAAAIAITPAPVAMQQTLSVSVSGTGSGTVTGAGISCPGSCSHSYATGTSVSLSATASAGSFFAGWSGACIGQGACSVPMNAPQAVSAIFALEPPKPACKLAPKGDTVLLKTPKGTKHHPAKKVTVGILTLRVSCDQDASASLTGTITELVGKKHKHQKQATKTFRLGPVQFRLKAAVGKSVTLSLPASARDALANDAQESVALELTATNANGIAHARSIIHALQGLPD